MHRPITVQRLFHMNLQSICYILLNLDTVETEQVSRGVFWAIFEKIGHFLVTLFFASVFENHVQMAVLAVKTEAGKHFKALSSTTI